jgi:hypothetical protein
MEGCNCAIDGAENPVGIAKDLKAYAEENGEIVEKDKYSKMYVPRSKHCNNSSYRSRLLKLQRPSYKASD